VSDHQRPDESVSALLRAAGGPATDDELAGADAAVARFVEVVLSDTPAAPPVISQPVDAPPVVVEPEKAQPARRLRSVPVPARAAGIIAAVTLWSTGMAAAATGHLPDPVQHAVSNTAAHVGLSLPDPSDDDLTVRANEQGKNDEDDDATTSSSSSSSSSTTTSSTTSPPTTTATSTRAGGGAALAPTTSTDDDDEAVDEEHGGQGPDVNGPAHDGLCNAYLRGLANGNPKDPAVPPWRNLLDAATKAGKSIEQFCGVTTTTTAAAAATTASTSTSTSTTSTTIEDESEGDDNGGGNGSGGGNNGSEGKAPIGAGQGPGNNIGQGSGADGSNAHGGNANSNAAGS
jgi:hypothetical protein